MKQFLVFLGLLTTIFTAFFVIPSSIRAQGTAQMTIIPPRFELFANPGDVVNETIRLRNSSDSPYNFGVLVEDFSSAGEKGQVVLEEGETDASYSLKNWIETSSQNLLVQPNDEVVLPFTITVPKDAEPGGHYASILFQLGGEPAEGVTSVQHRVGALVLLRVSGDIVEDATIESFSAPAYSKSGPVSFDLRVKNNGTTHIRPKGSIIITNLFGKKIDEIPLNGFNVFPQAIRKMTTDWSRENIAGHFTATLVATYGQQNKPLTAATNFTVISPLTAILLIIGVMAGIIFILSLITGKNRILKALKVLTSDN